LLQTLSLHPTFPHLSYHTTNHRTIGQHRFKPHQTDNSKQRWSPPDQSWSPIQRLEQRWSRSPTTPPLYTPSQPNPPHSSGKF